MRCNTAGRCFAVRHAHPTFVACTPANLLTECFVGCGPPGNCGWAITSPPGTASFDGVKLNEGSFGASNTGAALKPLLGVMPISDWTLQFKFKEIPVPQTGNINYYIRIGDPVGNLFEIALSGNGNALVTKFGGSAFSGPWLPAGGGASHVVHLTMPPGFGIPATFVDGVLIPLVPGAPFPGIAGPNTLSANIANADLNGQGAYEQIFLTGGIFAPTTKFCCP